MSLNGRLMISSPFSLYKLEGNAVWQRIKCLERSLSYDCRLILQKVFEALLKGEEFMQNKRLQNRSLLRLHDIGKKVTLQCFFFLL